MFGPVAPGGDDLFALLATIADSLRTSPDSLTGSTGDVAALDAVTRNIQNELAPSVPATTRWRR